MQDAFKCIQEICADKIGLNSLEVSDTTWRRALHQRQLHTGAKDDTFYLQLLKKSPHELQQLFELLIVTESWFFRDKTAFDYMSLFCLQQGHDSLRLLSIPCAAGEEPYSMAIALLDAGIPASRFHVDAYDINQTALEKAKQGIYNKNAFRGKSFDSCAKYFTQHNVNYIISEIVHRQVSFRYGNACTFSAHGPYHVIFCRNLLIYMHPAARKTVLENLKRCLSLNGILVVAPAEIEVVRRYGFSSVGPPLAHALQPTNKKIQVKKQDITIATTLTLAEHHLEKAKQCADAGFYDEALKHVMQHLESAGPDPEAYFLLGLIHHANNEEKRAKEYFLKTIYLKPDHTDALLCLALLSEQQGDKRQAELYRRRAQRS